MGQPAPWGQVCRIHGLWGRTEGGGSSPGRAAADTAGLLLTQATLLQTGRDGCFSTEVPVASFDLTGLNYKSWLYAYASLLEEGTGEHSHADSHPGMSRAGGAWRMWHNRSVRVSSGSLSFLATSISCSVPLLAFVSFFLYS